jgi:uncharacterized membrane protein
VLGVASVTLIGALLLLVLSFCAGLIAKTRLGRGCVAWIEKVLLSKMPGYVLVRNMVGDLVSSLDSLGREQQQRSVLVRFDDTWQLGIVVDQFASGLLSVFVPGAPSPLSGSLCFVEPDRVRPSGLSVHETTELLKRLGVGSARELAAQF